MKLVFTLDGTQQLGAKAENLFLLQKNGFPIPAFCVVPPTSAQLITANDREILNDALQKLGGNAFAVRSSSSVEDSAQRSWAGMFLSELNISPQDVPSAIERCWNSARTEQVKAYTKTESGVNVSVIIQIMVEPLIAGVAFSKHPVTQSPNQMVVEAVEGLGEALVQGQVEPSTSIIDQVSKKTLEQLGPDLFPSTEAKRELAERVDQIKALFEHDVDVEWAIDQRQKLWILQARPITT